MVLYHEEWYCNLIGPNEFKSGHPQASFLTLDNALISPQPLFRWIMLRLVCCSMQKVSVLRVLQIARTTAAAGHCNDCSSCSLRWCHANFGYEVHQGVYTSHRKRHKARIMILCLPNRLTAAVFGPASLPKRCLHSCSESRRRPSCDCPTRASACVDLIHLYAFYGDMAFHGP